MVPHHPIRTDRNLTADFPHRETIPLDDMIRGGKDGTEIAELVPVHRLTLGSKIGSFPTSSYDPYHDAAHFSPVALNVTKRL